MNITYTENILLKDKIKSFSSTKLGSYEIYDLKPRDNPDGKPE
ncbi:hypothetical protein [Paenibacillus wynnii]|nr:hypothetical protein [Paenibacillus wynnii]